MEEAGCVNGEVVVVVVVVVVGTKEGRKAIGPLHTAAVSAPTSQASGLQTAGKYVATIRLGLRSFLALRINGNFVLGQTDDLSGKLSSDPVGRCKHYTTPAHEGKPIMTITRSCLSGRC